MIVVVSGLPRSGTSMMMRMVSLGGVPVVTDNQRSADEDNLLGYFEDERAKTLHRDNSWLGEAVGKAVKIISFQLRHLPPTYRYKVIFMLRNLDEVLASQRKMMERRGEPVGDVEDDKMKRIFQKHLSEVKKWLASQENIETLYVDYLRALEDPASVAREVKGFLGMELDAEKMVEAVDPSLYRQRVAKAQRKDFHI